MIRPESGAADVEVGALVSEAGADVSGTDEESGGILCADESSAAVDIAGDVDDVGTEAVVSA